MFVVLTQESLTKLAILPAYHSAAHLKCLPFVLSGCPAHFRQHIPPSPSILLAAVLRCSSSELLRVSVVLSFPFRQVSEERLF